MKRQRKLKLLKCPQCGKEFLQKTAWQKCCSKQCYRKFSKAETQKWSREYYKKNKKRINLQNKMLLAVYKREIFRLLGDKCNICGDTNWKHLQIDHIEGGGYRERIKNGYFLGTKNYVYILNEIKRGKKKYQLLCANCNMEKRINSGENHRKYFDQPSFIEIYEALCKGRDGIVWKGKKFLFYKGKQKTK